MEVKASAKHIKKSPRKVRLVVDLVRGLEVDKALAQLKFSKKWAALPVSKLIDSGIANAVNNYELDRKNLFVKEIKVNDGTTLHRWMPRAYGRATPIRKRTSHIDLVLAEIKDSGKKGPKKQKIEAPIKLGAEPKKDDGVKIKEKKDENKSEEDKQEKGKDIIDPRGEGKGKYTRSEGKSGKGFIGKMFRRKSG